MARDKTLIQKRNQDIRREYISLQKKYPRWRDIEIRKLLAEKYYLSLRTIEGIIWN